MANTKLDTLWAKAVKENAGNKCEYCGKTEYLNAHHIFTRVNRSTRWDLENGICLCAGHHMLNSRFSAHGTPLIFADWIRDMRGEKWYKSLRKRADTLVKLTKSDLLRIEQELIGATGRSR